MAVKDKAKEAKPKPDRGTSSQGPVSAVNKKKRKPAKFRGGFGDFPGVNMRDLNRLIRSQIRPEIKALRRERRDVRRDARDEIQSTRNQYKRTKADLNKIYGETGEYIAGRNADTLAGFNQAKTDSSASQAALIAQLGLNASGVSGGATDELGRLGISGDQFLGGAQADANFMGGLAAQQGANQQSNLDLMASAAGGIGNLLLGMNQGSLASSLGQARNDRTDALNDIRSTRRDTVSDINRAIRDTRSSRKDLAAQLYQQLLQTNWGMFVDSKNLQQNQQQINLQRRAQRFSERQSRRAASGSGGGSGGSGGGGGSRSGGGSGGSSSNNYYTTSNDLLLGALLGGKKGKKGKK